MVQVVVGIGPVDAECGLLVAVLQMGAAAPAAPAGRGRRRRRRRGRRQRLAGRGASRPVDVARRRGGAGVAGAAVGWRHFLGDVDVVVVVVIAFLSSGILLLLLIELDELPVVGWRHLDAVERRRCRHGNGGERATG